MIIPEKKVRATHPTRIDKFTMIYSLSLKPAGGERSFGRQDLQSRRDVRQRDAPQRGMRGPLRLGQEKSPAQWPGLRI